jgi:hypothetical protein
MVTKWWREPCKRVVRAVDFHGFSQVGRKERGGRGRARARGKAVGSLSLRLWLLLNHQVGQETGKKTHPKSAMTHPKRLMAQLHGHRPREACTSKCTQASSCGSTHGR